MIEGFLGTRADGIVDTVVAVSGILPFVLLYSFFLASRGRYRLHKKIQSIMLLATFALVIALEADIRFGTISKAAAQSSFSGSLALGVFFVIHLAFAISSFAGWVWLVAKSYRTYPKPFHFAHKRWGLIVFVGLCMTSITGWILYLMAFAW
ncbi:MAG: hypothetical protein B6D59_02590 [Campylobacteraceae bacterium 4484_4]|nr:MAG: hypothetical protein B6D59_02590 [Campylobacteraceae bacterium 4484_4]